MNISGKYGLSDIAHNDITPYNHADFIIKIPYAGKKLKWDIFFDPEDFTFPPDFDFNDDYFLANPDIEMIEKHIPNLGNWNLDNPKMLAIILKEFLEYYKQLQIEKLRKENIYFRYYEEYEKLISGDQIKAENVEVSVDGTNITFLIEIKLDLTVLPEYCSDYELNNSDDTILLKIIINKMDGSNTKCSVQYPLNMELILGDHLPLPKFARDVAINEYVSAIKEILMQRVSEIAENCRLRKEFMTSLHSLVSLKIVESDTEHFKKLVMLAKNEDYGCLVTTIAGNKFPQENPAIKLSSVYCQEGKSCNKVLPKFQYNTSLSPDKNAHLLVQSLSQAICQLKQHKC
ncbi:unnamed protein product [Acanthoscelides obtectus]|uniref:BRISC and BRCA1-A complex member 2 n=1 Tax=Acanthoscelides obtectus TaxID=200917 RepID=A0A9P0LI55_ACAOB|nr:unnamed protein product [Acanthoscelides obtectus]CAK1663086.1 BRISC and BRCA1-A complex member 2 [Acanthoscelides obtectus]